MLAGVNAYHSLHVCVCVSACFVCCVFMCPPPRALRRNQRLTVRAHTPQAHTCPRLYSLDIRSCPIACAPQAHTYVDSMTPFFVLCVRTLCGVPVLFPCASPRAHAYTHPLWRALCLCAISVVVLLGVVLRDLSLRCITCMRQWMNGNVCLSVNVYASCVRVDACAWVCVYSRVCMRVYA